MNISLKNRVLWLDFARALAIFLVVLIHSTEMNGYIFTLKEINNLGIIDQIIAFCFFVLGRLGVPIFLYLTGFLLVDREFGKWRDWIEFYKRHLMPLICTFEIWILIQIMFLSSMGESITYKGIIDTCLGGKTYRMIQMWYMPMIIGIYFLIPIISNLLKFTSKKLFILIMLVLFLGTFFFPDINMFNNVLFLENEKIFPEVNNKFCYIFYLLLGWYVKISKINYKQYLLWGSFIFSFWITVVLQIFLYKNNFFYNIWYDFTLLPVCSISLFLLIYSYKNSLVCNEEIIKKIAVWSLGIYFIHPMIILMLKKVGLKFEIGYINAIITTIFTFSISAIMVMWIKKIPGIRKIVEI